MFRKCEQTCETFCDNVIPFLHLILVKLHYQHFFCFFKRHFQDINIQGFCCGFGSFQSNLDSQTKIRWKALKSQKKKWWNPRLFMSTFYHPFLSSWNNSVESFRFECLLSNCALSWMPLCEYYAFHSVESILNWIHNIFGKSHRSTGWYLIELRRMPVNYRCDLFRLSNFNVIN